MAALVFWGTFGALLLSGAWFASQALGRVGEGKRPGPFETTPWGDVVEVPGEMAATGEARFGRGVDRERPAAAGTRDRLVAHHDKAVH